MGRKVTWCAKSSLADVANMRSSVGMDQQVPGEVHLGSKQFGTLIALELRWIVHCTPVIGQPALRDKTFVTLRARESAVTSVQLHVVPESLGPPSESFAADRALQSPTFTMLTKVSPQKLAPVCSVLAVRLWTGERGEVGGWMFVLYVKDETNIRSKLLQALAAPKY